MIRIPIYVERAHPRLKYVINFIQNCYQDIEFESIDNQEAYLKFHGPKVNYSAQQLAELELWIPNRDHLNLDLTESFIPISKVKSDGVVLFCDDHDSELGFDIFASVFWMLSRAEEYGTQTKDQHGRFLAQDSLMCSLNTNKFPVVDYWCDLFINQLCLKFGLQIYRKKRKLHVTLGVDVDQFWKFKNKGLWKNGLGLIRDFCFGRFQLVRERIMVLTRHKKDPFETYNMFQSLALDRKQIYFFILSGGKTTYDKNHNINSIQVKNLLHQLHSFANIALHPSYQVNEMPELLSKEKSDLEKSIGVSIKSSRQHFLRVQMPHTYRALLDVGIEADFSMVYADSTGFRAGTCQAFYWYDLIQERETSLQIMPVIAMDRTYLDYEKKSVEKSLKDIQSLIELTVKYEGLVQIIWHNSSFDVEHEWKGWEDFFKSLIKLIKNSNDQ